MSTATAGRAREHRVRDDLCGTEKKPGKGWLLIARSAGSKGPADLVLAHPEHGVALVQVGTPSKTLGPADRARLLHAAELCSALALLAVVTPRRGVRYWLVNPGPASGWDEWRTA